MPCASLLPDTPSTSPSTPPFPRRPCPVPPPQTLLIIMEYLISAAPVALVSLTAGAIASASDQRHVAIDIALFLAACTATYMSHTLVFVPSLFAAVTWRNPWAYLSKFRYAFRKAFRTSSADEALDKTVEAAVETGEVSATVAGFVLPLGIDLNLDGAGVYYPLAVLMLAHTGGMDADVTPGTLVIIAIVSVMTSIGAHTMPNGGLIMVRRAGGEMCACVCVLCAVA